MNDFDTTRFQLLPYPWPVAKQSAWASASVTPAHSENEPEIAQLLDTRK